jgi:CheY-like chemotaxis protein
VDSGGGDGVVLIVDDDDAIRETFALALQLHSYATATAANGKEALAWLNQARAPRLILLDLMMPVMDGWQLLTQLRKDERLARIPVVVITAFGQDLKVADGFPVITKPVELKNLLALVGRYFKDRG